MAKVLSVRLPDELFDSIDDKAKAADMVRSDYVLQLLSSTLDIPISSNGRSSGLAERVNGLESKVESLTKELAKAVAVLNGLGEKVNGIQRTQQCILTSSDSQTIESAVQQRFSPEELGALSKPQLAEIAKELKIYSYKLNAHGLRDAILQVQSNGG